ncbi:MAG: T9SS type A sorting domain-containing protein [Fimbriimonadaceae bacterium]|nr:T9SS type A sorting domain-containing protein [Chitinophagales bacterium]
MICIFILCLYLENPEVWKCLKFAPFFYNEKIKTVNIKVHNLLGEEIHSFDFESLDNTPITINVKPLKSGYYIFSVTTPFQTRKMKVEILH